MHKSLFVHLALLLVGLIYGANYVIAKWAMPHYFGPFAFIVMRVCAATALFWLLDAVLNKPEKIAPRDYRLLAVSAVFGVIVNQLCFFAGLNFTSAVNASLIMTMVPVIVLVVSYFVLRESITSRKVTGLLLGLVGTVLLIFSREVSLQNDGFVGDLLIVVNASSYSVYLVIVKPLMARYRSLTVIKWVFLFGMPVVIPFGASQLGAVEWSLLPASAFWILAFVILCTTFLAYLLNAWALKFVNASVVGIYIYIQPVFAGMLTIALGEEPFSWYKTFLALLIFAGVFLVSYRRK